LLRWATVPEQSGPKSGGGTAVPLSVWGAWTPSTTMWSGPRPTSVPSGILIHPAVWPQYTNVTDRQDKQNRQRSDSIGLSFYKRLPKQKYCKKHRIAIFICYRPSVCRVSSVTFVRPTQAVQIFGNISTALGTLAIQ